MASKIPLRGKLRGKRKSLLWQGRETVEDQASHEASVYVFQSPVTKMKRTLQDMWGTAKRAPQRALESSEVDPSNSNPSKGPAPQPQAVTSANVPFSSASFIFFEFNALV